MQVGPSDHDKSKHMKNRKHGSDPPLSSPPFFWFCLLRSLAVRLAHTTTYCPPDPRCPEKSHRNRVNRLRSPESRTRVRSARAQAPHPSDSISLSDWLNDRADFL